MRKRVIVIGAGPGDLAAAMLLAGHGYQVDVFEK
ncbi:NAD(P)-binding protein [Priestia flexa]|nr:NAD(P)-binding protein [Priestia flexa]